MSTLLEDFQRLRPRLFGIAYRMLGSRADADDMLQEAWLRWDQQDAPPDLHSSDAWLVTLTTRLCIDRLRSLQREREHYPGPWLPEPLVEDDAQARLELIGDISMAFMLLLERLGPEERAAFLLVDVFDFDYADLAPMLGKTEAACRQLLHRARERVRSERTRFPLDPAEHHDLLGRFAQALHSGDRARMAQLFTGDAQFIGDGGGKALAVMRVVRGAERIARFWISLGQKNPGLALRPATINGEPGLLGLIEGRLDTTLSFAFEEGRIAAVYVVRNPDKLARVAY